ncbi:MAG: FtsX-like permease family protein [Candidatus Margulisiibacteriota bacterium]
MSLFKLTYKSILSRKLTSILLIVSISLSTMLLIGVQKIKSSAKTSFSSSISDTDLIIGARSGEAQLLLYTIFRQGSPIANISWRSVKQVEALSDVDWVVPLSLGDSHKGFAVLGTNLTYFNHYKYGRKRPLTLKEGRVFKAPLDVVLGYDVAKKLNYRIGDSIYLSHGLAKGNLPVHTQKAFTIVGILNRTGTPVDKTLHIPLTGITAIHMNWNQPQLQSLSFIDVDLTPASVTGALVGLKSPFSLFSVQQQITNWPDEPLMAIIPGVSLARLWNSIGTIDTAFWIISVLVLIISFIGLLLALFMSLNQRKRELAILRTMGAHPTQLAIILTIESFLITFMGVVFGLLLMIITGLFLTPILESQFGLVLALTTLSQLEIFMALGIVGFGVIIGFIPAILAYKRGLTEGFISV